MMGNQQVQSKALGCYRSNDPVSVVSHVGDWSPVLCRMMRQ